VKPAAAGRFELPCRPHVRVGIVVDEEGGRENEQARASPTCAAQAAAGSAGNRRRCRQKGRR